METQNHPVVIGKKQILKELKNGNVQEIVIAVDAEAEYVNLLVSAAREHSVNYLMRGTMAEIAASYGIDVPSGAVGVLKM